MNICFPPFSESKSVEVILLVSVVSSGHSFCDHSVILFFARELVSTPVTPNLVYFTLPPTSRSHCFKVKNMDPGGRGEAFRGFVVIAASGTESSTSPHTVEIRLFKSS